jgi:short-subunit dehydrogenase
MRYNLALVTGATSGLGKALCHLLASKNIPLLLTARDPARLEELKRTLSVPVTCYAADLSRKEERKGLLELIATQSPDLILNNAGFGLYGDALTHSTAEHLDMLEVNASALLEISLEAARALIANNKIGTILNISSAAAFFSYPTFSVYAASKAFVLHFSKSFDPEVAPHGIRVLCACPGQIATDFQKRASKTRPQKKMSLMMSAEKAAACIWSQIEKQQAVHIFDWRYQILVFVGRLLPERWTQKALRK